MRTSGFTRRAGPNRIATGYEAQALFQGETLVFDPLGIKKVTTRFLGYKGDGSVRCNFKQPHCTPQIKIPGIWSDKA